ncbi:MAG: hypothetical protein ACK4ND_02110 [Cytophagaceae bacterium]
MNFYYKYLSITVIATALVSLIISFPYSFESKTFELKTIALSDENWENGIYLHTGGFLISASPENDKLNVGDNVHTATLAKRKIISKTKSGNYINVFVDGGVINPQHVNNNTIYHTTKSFTSTFIFHFIFLLTGAVVLFLILFYDYKAYSIIYIIVFLTGTYVAVKTTIYSPIDEAAHFDFVNYIEKNKELPKACLGLDHTYLSMDGKAINIPGHLNHEYIQPPMYYAGSALIASLINLFSNDAHVRLISLRLAGVLLLMLSIFIIRNAYLLLTNKGIIKQNDHLLFSISLLFALSPIFLKIMIPVNNEHFLLPLISLLVFLIIRDICKDRTTLLTAGLIGATVATAILTKLTAAYIFPLVFGYFLLRKKYKEVVAFSIITGAILSPWLYFNLQHYNAFTGVKQHFEIVQPIVNPYNVKFTVVNIIEGLPGFYGGLWFSSSFNSLEGVIGVIIKTTLLLSLCYSIFWGFKALKESGVKINNTSFYLNYILAGMVLLNISILGYITLTTPVFSMIGRYLFMNLLSIILIFYVFTSHILNQQFVKFFSGFCFCAAWFLLYNYIYSLS